MEKMKRHVTDRTFDHERALAQESVAQAVTRLERIVGRSAVNFDRAQELADLAMVLKRLELPKVRAWCVMKHYGTRESAPASRPIVWCGCKTREQAEAFAAAIQAHYNADSPGGDYWGNRFLVEHGEASVQDLIDPACTPEHYVRGLGA